MGADPDLNTHRAYGVPQDAKTPEFLQILQSRYAGLARELQLGVPAAESYEAINRLDGFTLTEDDGAERARHNVQFTGHFLVDREGVVRWLTIEGAQDGLAGLEKLPTEEELLAAARALPW